MCHGVRYEMIKRTLCSHGKLEMSGHFEEGSVCDLLLRSCVGPRGRPKLLSPSSVVSSSSRRLLPLLPTSSPFTRIVLRAAKGLEDGGLTCALLALWLAYHPPPTPRPLVGSLHDHFSAEFLLILETEVAVEVDFRELHPLRCLVRTLLSSKPASSLTRVDTEVVCSLVLGAFLEAVNGGGVVVVVVGLGLAPCHSRMVHGVALPIGEGDEERIRRTLPEGPFRACLFTRSLAGEVDWPVEVLAAPTKEAVEGASLLHLAHLVDEAVEEGVRVLLCQKVVHPRLKKRLHGAGVVVLDRIGGENATRIRSTFEERCGDAWFGTVSRSNVECLGRSRFLVLSTSSSSLLLTHHNQEALAELEVVCRQSLSALFRLLVPHPLLCFGGGCSEITAAVLLANKVRVSLDSVCKETRSTPGHVLSSLEFFVRGVAHLCASIHQGKVVDLATDVERGHLWRQCPPTGRCACGTRDASSVSDWRRLTDIGDALLMAAPPSVPSSIASTPVDGLVPSVPQNTFASCYAPHSMSTTLLVQPNASTNVSVPQTVPTSLIVQQNDPRSVPQTFHSLAQNAHKVINHSMPDSVLSSTPDQEILLDEFVGKRRSLSLAFETSSMLLKTTECIHTSPIAATAEQTKVEENTFS